MDMDFPKPGTPTLQDIARRTYARWNWPVDDERVTAALKEAGIDPTDEKERVRFRKLCLEYSEMNDADHMGEFFYTLREYEQLGRPEAFWEEPANQEAEDAYQHRLHDPIDPAD
jgi:hypothetical protein